MADRHGLVPHLQFGEPFGLCNEALMARMSLSAVRASDRPGRSTGAPRWKPLRLKAYI